MVLEVAEGACVRLGFAEPMALPRVREMVETGDSAGLVGSLRPEPVQPGDAVLVPAGVPHSIDAGVLVLELQEPTDLSIVLEAEDLDLDPLQDGHLGLGFDLALQALRLEPPDTSALMLRAGAPSATGVTGATALLPPAAEPYFRAHRLGPSGGGGTQPAGFAVLLCTAGAGRLETGSAGGLELRRGAVAVVPYAAGTWQLSGPVDVIACRPPRPDAATAS